MADPVALDSKSDAHEDPAQAGTSTAGPSSVARIPTWLPQFMAVAAAWLIMRPYRGIVHDARLYLQFSVFSDNPAFQANDLLISNDNQMSRSVYVLMLRPLLDVFGIAAAAIVATIAGLVAWITGISVLGRTLLGKDWWILVVIAPAFPAHWGPLFSLAESFAAPRALAEGLAIAAIACALMNRFGFAAALVGAAALVHPLVALPAVAIVIVVAAFRWRWLVPVLTVGGVLAVIAALVDPLGIAGTDSFDPEWTEIIAGRAFVVFPGEWWVRGWMLTLFAFIMTSLPLMTRSSDRLRRFAVSSIIVAGVGMILSVVFAWVFVSPLVVQLQPWRALWVLHIAALAAFTDILVSAYRKRSRESVLRAIAAAGLVAAVGVPVPAIWFAVQVLLSVPYLAPTDSRIHRLAVDSPFAMVMVASSAGLFIAQILGATVRVILIDAIDAVDWSRYSASLPAATISVALAIVLIALIAQGEMVRGGGVVARTVALVVLLGLIVFGLAVWDHRSEWQQFNESLEEPIFDLPQDSLVLVEDEGDTFGTVMLLQRPTYYSNYGAAGVSFSRELAMDFHARGVVALSVDLPWAIEYENGLIDYNSRVRPTGDAIRAACEADHGPTHMLLRRQALDLEGVIWVSPVPIPEPDLEPDTGDPFNPAMLVDAFVLYDCSTIVG
ncbi:MAG: hypothetical protein ACR2NG_02855 [Acidimicrobiia bacterium]